MIQRQKPSTTTDDTPINQTAGKLGLVLGQRLFGLRGLADVLDSGYLYYVLQTERLQSELSGRATGTTVLGIRQSALRNVRIPAPGYLEQVAIAEVLGALDDKITLNRSIANVADELVRMEYVAATGDATETVVIADVAEQVKLKAEPTEVAADLPYVGLEHLPRREMWLEEAGTADEVTSDKWRHQAGDVLFGKLRPYFHKVVSAPSAGICSTDIFVLRARDSRLAGFALAAVASDEVISACSAASHGTRMPRVSWKYLSQLEVPWPGEQAAAELSHKVAAVRDMVESRLTENRCLSATRDALLPALMSGRLRVKDAEKVVGEAV